MSSATPMLITLDDASPLLVTSSNWSQNHTGDLDTDLYFDGTFKSTYTKGEFLTLEFNGTQIDVYGAKRGNHGQYQVKLDDEDPLTATGLGDGLFQQKLYSKDGLDTSTLHKIVITSTANNGTWLDVDYVVITAAAADSGSVTTTIMDDSGGKFEYTPSRPATPTSDTDSWQQLSFVTDLSYNSTFTGTLNANYSVMIPFNGTSIQVFGGTSSNHGNYGASLNGGEQKVFNGYFPLSYNARTPLFTASGLTDASHQVVLTNLEQGLWFDVDYAVVNTTRDWSAAGLAASSSSAAAAASASATPASDSHSDSTPVGAIAGGVVGGVVALAAAALLLFFLRRQQRKALGKASDTDSEFGGRNKTPVPEVPQVTPFIYSGPAQPSTSSLPLHPGLNEGGHGRMNSFIALTDADATSLDPSSISPPAVHSPWLPLLMLSPESDISSPPASSAAVGDYLNLGLHHESPREEDLTSPGSNSNTGSQSGSAALSKVEQAEQDRLAQEALERAVVPAPRMRVPGRDVDGGPLLATEEVGHAMLPPDYEQATEPGSPPTRGSIH